MVGLGVARTDDDDDAAAAAAINVDIVSAAEDTAKVMSDDIS